MPTVRTRRSRYSTARRVTREAVEAFAAGDWLGVFRACDLRPWKAHPFDVGEPEPPAWMTRETERQHWREAWELRQALEAGHGH